MIAEQTPPQDSARADANIGDLRPGVRPDQLTYTHYEALGEAAYAHARELERSLEADGATVAEAYEDAARNLTAVTWMAPNGEVMDDPVRLLKISDSLAKVAQAEVVKPYSEQQYDWNGEPIEIDRRQNLRRISSELLIAAGKLIEGADGQEPGGETGDEAAADAKPAEAISTAVAEAGGDADNVVVLHPAKVARTAEYVIEQLTGEHDIPPESAQLELIAA
jgi:hypothetical protein